MTGEEWLAKVFEPALGQERMRALNVFAEFSGALRALEACGLLKSEQASDGQRRLDAAHWEAQRRPLPEIASPGSVAHPPPNLLRHVFAPLAPLVDFNGVTLVLASVELWTRSVRLRIAGLNNATSDRLDEEHRQALEGWATKVRDAHDRGTVHDDPPREAGARLLDVGLTLADDVGTDYQWTGASSGGTGSEWRLEQAFEPGMPAAAGELPLRVSGANGSLVHELQLELP
ncbi:MAG: hypothetical protein M3R09_03095 [Actinomycetota bacterium]|nr:hypothetical protein [Actinomycetota bacterium]